jgi:RsiW-degrading membrane proteinase PrsW (M82 family)
MRPQTPIAPGNPGHNFRHSTLLPILSNPALLWSKGYVLPGILTVVASIALFGAMNAFDFQSFVVALSFYVAFLQCLIIYLMCGRRRIWWMMLAVFAVSYALMFSPLFSLMAPPFRLKAFWDMAQSGDLVGRFIGFFFVAGLLEELYKALPLLALAALAIYRSRAQGAAGRTTSFGLTEPLDGIALGVAAAAAFGVVETVVVYVPQMMNSSYDQLLAEFSKLKLQVANDDPAAAKAAAEAASKAIVQLLQEVSKGQGLQLLIARLVSEIGGHLAYSGYFGYFIGMAVLRPKSAPVLLLTGLVTAAALHAAWDACGNIPALSIVIGVLSYVFLVAAILKARRISPTRGENFATVALPLPGPHPHDIPQSPVNRPLYVYATATDLALDNRSPAAPNSALVLDIADVRRPLVAGLQIEPQALGSAGAGRGRGPVAEVESRAADGSAVLRNTGARSWQVKLPTGQVRQVDAGKALRLQAGVEIDFGGIKGMVENG